MLIPRHQSNRSSVRQRASSGDLRPRYWLLAPHEGQILAGLSQTLPWDYVRVARNPGTIVRLIGSLSWIRRKSIGSPAWVTLPVRGKLRLATELAQPPGVSTR